MLRFICIVSLMSSAVAFASEPIVHNGEQGYFFSEDSAKKVVKQAEELKTQKSINEDLKKKIKIQQELVQQEKAEKELEKKYSELWKLKYDSCNEEYTGCKKSIHINVYIVTGIVAGGIVMGIAVMYISSEILLNIK